jgi:hypothetical protein
MAYTNPYPGTLVEKCTGQPTHSHELLPYGMIHLNSSCLYDMLNGPLSVIDNYLPYLTISQTAENSAIIIREIDPEVFKHHLQEYAVYYVIGLSLIIIFFIYPANYILLLWTQDPYM